MLGPTFGSNTTAANEEPPGSRRIAKTKRRTRRRNKRWITATVPRGCAWSVIIRKSASTGAARPVAPVWRISNSIGKGAASILKKILLSSHLGKDGLQLHHNGPLLHVVSPAHSFRHCDLLGFPCCFI